MSDAPQGPGWWQASDGKWYSPELHPDHTQAMGQASQPPTPPPSPGTPPAAGGPPPSDAPTGYAGGPPLAGGPPPAGGPTGFAGGPPTGLPPTMGGTPPSGEPPKGNGGKIAIIVGAFLVLILIIAGIAFALGGSDGDDDDTAASTTSTTEEEEEDDEDLPVERTLVPPDDDEDEDDATTTTTSDIDLDEDLGGLGFDPDEVDPETLMCVGLAVEDDPALAEALESGASDPTAPEFRTLFEILTDCGARDYLEESFLAELTSTQATCVDEVFATMSDDEFIDLILGLAGNDMSAADPILSCMT